MNLSIYRKVLLLISLALVSFVACDRSANISNFSISANQQEDEVILEMFTESKYSVYPPGRILNLRVYKSGKAEYDLYPPVQKEGQFRVERTKLTLTSDELAKIKALIAETMDTAKESYGPSVPILDAAIETTLKLRINGNQKVIVLTENHSNLVLEKKKNVYPDSLLNLLFFIQQKTNELSGRI